jgi:hypothetical protein
VHKDMLPAAASQSPFEDGYCPLPFNISGTYAVYTPDLGAIMAVPIPFVVQCPPQSARVTRLVACKHYHPERNACTKGRRCKYLHVNFDAIPPDTLVSHPVHVNYAWKVLTDCHYERHPPGGHMLVGGPNSDHNATSVSSEQIIKTSGSMVFLHDPSATGVPRHCAHYHFNRICNRGPLCSFIHVVHVDPAARTFQKAPAPSGRRRMGPPPGDGGTAESNPDSVESMTFSHKPYV